MRHSGHVCEGGLTSGKVGVGRSGRQAKKGGSRAHSTGWGGLGQVSNTDKAKGAVTQSHINTERGGWGVGWSRNLRKSSPTS